MRALGSGFSALLLAGVVAPQHARALQTGAGYSAYREEASRVVTVTAGVRYAAGPLHRALFGEHYRDLWTTPVQVPLLDLETYAGGLTPEEIGGGQQTRSLKLESEDGREYAFRPVDKDPTGALPSAYQETVVDRLAQDAISAGHPGAPLVASALLDAVGVLNARPQLFVMSAQERLGEFQKTFAGTLGYLEERPEEGFAGADEVVEWEELLELVEGDPSHRVHVREFLRARLVDHLLGDWDRHQGQWRWAGFREEGHTSWRPIPRDRDQALARYDGLLLGIARRVHPKLVNFGPRYPSALGLAWNAQELDRRLLASLQAEDFDSVAAAVEAALTDSVIDASIDLLPAAYRAALAPWMTEALRQRRDSLRAHAREYYGLLAEEVDVFGTERAELAEARRDAAGRLDLLVTTREGHDTTFRRAFDPEETRSVRLLLQGGRDSIHIDGPSGAGPLLEIEQEPGIDTVAAPSGAEGFRLYTPRPDVKQGKGDSTSAGQPPRDWGGSFGISPRAEYDADLGILLGVQAARTDYAFRRVHYGSRMRLVAQYATAAEGFRTELIADVRRVNPDLRLDLRVRASEIEVVRFSGFGNETPAPRGAFQEVDQWQFVVAPLLEYAATPLLRLQAGPIAKYTTTSLRGDRLIDRERPLGSTGFGRVGLQAGAAVTVPDSAGMEAASLGFRVGGSAFPPTWSGSASHGELHAEAVGRLPVRVGPTPLIAMRVGAKKVWGEFPYDESAFLGGQGTLRGYAYQRFAGEAMLYGSAEVRVPVARVLEDWVPTRVGMFALADAGRVWADGTRSRRVHAAGGGGVWLSFFEERHTVSVAVASGEEGSLWYVRTGLAF